MAHRQPTRRTTIRKKKTISHYDAYNLPKLAAFTNSPTGSITLPYLSIFTTMRYCTHTHIYSYKPKLNFLTSYDISTHISTRWFVVVFFFHLYTKYYEINVWLKLRLVSFLHLTYSQQHCSWRLATNDSKTCTVTLVVPVLKERFPSDATWTVSELHETSHWEFH